MIAAVDFEVQLSVAALIAPFPETPPPEMLSVTLPEAELMAPVRVRSPASNVIEMVLAALILPEPTMSPLFSVTVILPGLPVTLAINSFTSVCSTRSFFVVTVSTFAVMLLAALAVVFREPFDAVSEILPLPPAVSGPLIVRLPAERANMMSPNDVTAWSIVRSEPRLRLMFPDCVMFADRRVNVALATERSGVTIAAKFKESESIFPLPRIEPCETLRVAEPLVPVVIFPERVRLPPLSVRFRAPPDSVISPALRDPDEETVRFWPVPVIEAFSWLTF